jgi:methionyl aminopeptidase
MFDNLAKATHDATMSTIKMVGPDCLINELSKNIKEVIESYEVEINGTIYPVKAIKNLGGHNINQNIIHGGTLILCSPSDNNSYKNQRIQANQSYAIETFASTGKGFIVEDYSTELNHFMMPPEALTKTNSKLIFDISKKALNYIKKDRGTLPFASRWIYKNMDNSLRNKTMSGVKELVNKGLVNKYPPLVDIKGSYTSQYEHTIYVSEKGVENLSTSTDY